MKIFKKKPPPVEPRIPEGTRVYCIGDIHGCLDLLEDLHQDITTHASNYIGTKKLIYVGDYIDRGPYSKGVIDLLLDKPLAGFDIIYLRGNHEQSFIDFLDHPVQTRAWLTYGGLDTLVSYGVQLAKLPTSDDEMYDLRDQLDSRVPDRHLEFMNNTEYSCTEGNYFFTHAGIRPGIPLIDQKPSDLMWIRDKFFSSKLHHEKIIVHGHTVVKEVEAKPNRIGIDTGAFASGKLTCLVLENNTQHILQTSR
ncbi:MAG: metallophosphoesterase family protein [Arenicellales bacterium]